MTSRNIIANKARCDKCGDVIESKHRHDWVQCSCRSLFVDGGLAYLRRGGSLDAYTELSEYEVVPANAVSTVPSKTADENE